MICGVQAASKRKMSVRCLSMEWKSNCVFLYLLIVITRLPSFEWCAENERVVPSSFMFIHYQL